MDFNSYTVVEVSLFIFAAIGAVAAGIFIFDWIWERVKKMGQNGSKQGVKSSPAMIKSNHHFLPLIMAISVFIFTTLGMVWISHMIKSKSQIPDTNQVYESEFRDDSSVQIAYDGRTAFQAGDYAYAIMFFSRCETNAGTNRYDSWQANEPLLAASVFHQYPTSEGYQAFTNSLNRFTEQIEQQLKETNGWFYQDDDAQLRDAEDQLKAAGKLLPTPEEKEYVAKLIERIDDFKSTYPPMK